MTNGAWFSPATALAIGWWALAAVALAAVLGLWVRAARCSPRALYAAGLIAVGMGKMPWVSSSWQLFLWGLVCDLAGFGLVAALLGWVLPRLKPLAARLRIPAHPDCWSARWFHAAQCLLTLTVTGLAIWIAVDFSFDGLGKGTALFGLAGRWAACPAALMLVGTSILMAWQSHGRWRANWQYAALIAGVFFTSSLGWAALDASSLTPWRDRSLNLLVSASMMTLLTSFGLGSVLPRGSDWIARGRRARPVFAGLALGLLVVVIGQRWL